MAAPSSNRRELSENTPLLNGSTRSRSDEISASQRAEPSTDRHNATSQNKLNDEEVQQSEIHAKTSIGLPEVRKRLKYILPAVGVGIFLAAADQTIIVSSYGIIGSDLNALNKTSWIATAYMLTVTSFQPLYGKLSDIFGRKSCLLVAYTIFGIGCLLCGLSQDINQLIIARALAGVGGGGLTTVVSILVSDIVPLRERGTWQGYLNIIFAAGSAAGAPFGGAVADSLGWRWAFNMQPPLCLLGIVSTSLVLKLPTPETATESWKTKLRRIDFAGALMLICTVLALLVALDRGSNVSWKDKYTISALVASALLCLAFVFVEAKLAKEPFAPARIIFNRSLLAGYLCNFFAFAGWLSALFYIPLHFQVVHKLSATGASLRLIPSIICSVTGSLFTGYYLRKVGKYYWLLVACYSALSIGLLLVFLFSGVAIYSMPLMIVGMCICAFSNGTGMTATLIGLIANAGPKDQAVVTACSYLFRSLGGVFGVSMSATVANSLLRTSLQRALGDGDDANEITQGVRRSLAYIEHLKPALKKLVILSYSVSTSGAFGFQIGLTVGAALSAIFVKEVLINKK